MMTPEQALDYLVRGQCMPAHAPAAKRAVEAAAVLRQALSREVLAVGLIGGWQEPGVLTILVDPEISVPLDARVLVVRAEEGEP